MKKFLKKYRFHFLILIALVLFTYIGILGNGFVSDDINGIVKNREIQTISSVLHEPFQFVQPVFYFGIYKLFGINPVPFHAVNLFFHLATTLCIFVIVIRMHKAAVAFITATLFAVHPLLSETVAWISAGSYGRYSFFFLLSFLLYLLYHAHKKKALLLSSYLFFLLSLFSSDKAPFLFLIFPLYESLFGKIKKMITAHLFYIMTAVGFIILRVSQIAPRLAALSPDSIPNTGSINPFIQIPFAIGSYLKLFFYPKDLTLFHTEFFTDPSRIPLFFLVFFAFMLVLIFSFQRNRAIFFWLIFFLITLLPTLTPFQIGNILAERYVYLGAVGLFVTVGIVLERLTKFKTFHTFVPIRTIIFCLFVIIILSLSLRTFIRVNDWKSELILGVSERKNAKESAVKYENSGGAWLQQGNFTQATIDFKKAIALRPSYADLYNNLGYAQVHLGDITSGMINYEKALRLNPRLWQAYDNIAAVHTIQKDYTKALSYLSQALKISPNNNDLLIHQGIVYLQMGDKKRAKEAYQKALDFDPYSHEASEGLKEASK